MPVLGDAARDSLAVAVEGGGAVAWINAPSPTNANERFVFAQLYETLVNVDCAGQVYPGLAQSWQRDTMRGRWLFTLRDDARFWDGSRLAAADVVVSLAAQDRFAVAMGERVVSIPYQDTLSPPLKEFAAPWLAVSRRTAGLPWPLGTGPYQPRAPDSLPSARVSRGRAWLTAAGYPSRPRPALAVLINPGQDLRDFLDRGADLLVTRDPATLEYADAQPEFSTVSLPWAAVYVLILPRGEGTAGLLDPTPDMPWSSAVSGAVRVEARQPFPPEGWMNMRAGRCPGVATRASEATGQSSRIVYDESDPVARDLAARLVALAAPTVIAHPAAAEAFAGLVRRGEDLGYILALPLRVFDDCRAVEHLQALAPWRSPQAAIVPLLEVRPRAVVRRGAAASIVDWDGTVRVGAGAWPEARRP